MADAAPQAQVQVVALRSLKADVAASLEVQRGNGAVRKASVVDVKKWLDAALRSADDAPVALSSRGQRASPSLIGDDVKAFLDALNASIDARVAELEKSPQLAKAPLAQWAKATLVSVCTGRARLSTADGGVAVAGEDAVREWLDATEVPVEASTPKR